jgi:hypothetical protein
MNTPQFVLAIVIECVVLRHHVQDTTTQPRVDIMDARGHTHAPAFAHAKSPTHCSAMCPAASSLVNQQ